MFGCRTSKKMTESLVVKKQEVATVTTELSKTEMTVNNDNVVNQTTTVDETTYYQPEKVNDSESSKPEPNNDPKKGAIKSTKRTVITNTSVDKGKAEIKQSSQSDAKVDSSLNTEQKQAEKEVKKANPNVKWFIILILAGVAVCFYFWKKFKL